MSSPLTFQQKTSCISLIGMPGAGKSTVGRALARHLDWALVDTDHLIEATYGTNLQTIADSLSKEAFLDLEALIVGSLQARQCVLATGGSVVYREQAMQHLGSLGPVVYLEVSFPLLQERIARNPQRGLAIAPGQSLEDIYAERQSLYTRYAQYTIEADALTPTQCSAAIMRALD
ncbi:MAG: homoserine kinase [Desulfovibrionaceae bacterium]